MMIFKNLLVMVGLLPLQLFSAQGPVGQSVYDSLTQTGKKVAEAKRPEVKVNDILLKNAKGLKLPLVLQERLKKDLSVSWLKKSNVSGDLKIRLEEDLRLAYCSKDKGKLREISVKLSLKDKKQLGYVIVPDVYLVKVKDFQALFLNKGVQLRNVHFEFKDDSIITHRLVNLFVNYLGDIVNVRVSLSNLGVYAHIGEKEAYSILRYDEIGQEQLAYGSCY